MPSKLGIGNGSWNNVEGSRQTDINTWSLPGTCRVSAAAWSKKCKLVISAEKKLLTGIAMCSSCQNITTVHKVTHG